MLILGEKNITKKNDNNVKSSNKNSSNSGVELTENIDIVINGAHDTITTEEERESIEFHNSESFAIPLMLISRIESSGKKGFLTGWCKDLTSFVISFSPF